MTSQFDKTEWKGRQRHEIVRRTLLSERSADTIIQDLLFPELRIKLANLGRLAMLDYLIFLSDSGILRVLISPESSIKAAYRKPLCTPIEIDGVLKPTTRLFGRH